jgi:hypothetical protein
VSQGAPSPCHIYLQGVVFKIKSSRRFLRVVFSLLIKLVFLFIKRACCSQCTTVTDIFPRTTGGAEAMCAEMGVRMLGRLPLDPALMRCCETGEPPTRPPLSLRDETCPVSTGRRTRRVQSVQEGGGGAGGPCPGRVPQVTHDGDGEQASRISRDCTHSRTPKSFVRRFLNFPPPAFPKTRSRSLKPPSLSPLSPAAHLVVFGCV